MKTAGILIIAGVAVLAQACAYNRPAEVTAQMARTEATLQQAQQSGAEVESLAELQSAKGKFADAQKELARGTEKGDREAVQLAKQAEVDAQFAAAKAQAARQEKAASEVQQGVNALRDEANRNVTESANP